MWVVYQVYVVGNIVEKVKCFLRYHAPDKTHSQDQMCAHMYGHASRTVQHNNVFV